MGHVPDGVLLLDATGRCDTDDTDVFISFSCGRPLALNPRFKCCISHQPSVFDTTCTPPSLGVMPLLVVVAVVALALPVAVGTCPFISQIISYVRSSKDDIYCNGRADIVDVGIVKAVVIKTNDVTDRIKQHQQ